MTPTILICTHNRAHRLADLFRSLAAMTDATSAEFVMVDSNSTDDTTAVLRELSAAHGLRVKLLQVGRPGLGYAQNVGIQEATGDPIVFTDDDCFPDRNFLRDMVMLFEMDPRLGFAGGRIELFNQADFPITIRTSPEDRIFEPGSFIPAGVIQGANMAFRRACILGIGGFDARFGSGGPFGGGNDVDAMARASAAGWRGGYFPGPLIYHDHGRNAQDAAALMRKYDRCRGAYYAKCLLGRSTRQQAARRVFWSWRSDLFRGDRGRLGRELLGALHFLATDFLLHYIRRT